MSSVSGSRTSLRVSSSEAGDFFFSEELVSLSRSMDSVSGSNSSLKLSVSSSMTWTSDFSVSSRAFSLSSSSDDDSVDGFKGLSSSEFWFDSSLVT